jgi:hypothetical protein
MIYELDEIQKSSFNANAREIDGRWVPARPMDGPWIYRLKAAWAVLRGEADAFHWPYTQKEFL